MPIGYSRNEGAPKARRCQRLLDTLSPTNAARATAVCIHFTPLKC